MGHAEDTHIQVQAVKAACPNSFIGMVGFSAGSGLLVTYTGKYGDLSYVQAAASLCPAYDISEAFVRLVAQYPSVDRHLLQSLKDRWIKPNLDLLAQENAKAVSDCLAAETVFDFIVGHIPFTGCKDLDDFWAQHNPILFYRGTTCPTVFLNAEDDIACVKENIPYHLVESTPVSLLTVTRQGSHVAYNEGLLGRGNFMARLTVSFFEAVRSGGETKMAVQVQAQHKNIKNWVLNNFSRARSMFLVLVLAAFARLYMRRRAIVGWLLGRKA
jgi:predicted alpha/beta-fold hydrolase